MPDISNTVLRPIHRNTDLLTANSSQPYLFNKLPCALVGIVLFCVADEIMVKRKLRKRCTVAYNNQFLPRARHGNIHSAYFREKANFIICITSRHADINNIAFLPLETINGIDSYFIGIYF